MNIGYEPVIAYCRARIRDLGGLPETQVSTSRIDELKMVIVLCEGLQKQFAMVEEAIGAWTGGPVAPEQKKI